MNKRLPPFSKRLLSINNPSWGSSADGKCHAYWLLCGSNAWNIAREWKNSNRRFVLLPPGEPPSDFNWKTLRGHPPLLLSISGNLSRPEMKQLIAALLSDGIERVLCLNENGINLYATPEGIRHAERC